MGQVESHSETGVVHAAKIDGVEVPTSGARTGLPIFRR